MPRSRLQPLRATVARLFLPGRRHLGLTLVTSLLWLLAWFDWSAWSLLPASDSHSFVILNI